MPVTVALACPRRRTSALSSRSSWRSSRTRTLPTRSTSNPSSKLTRSTQVHEPDRGLQGSRSLSWPMCDDLRVLPGRCVRPATSGRFACVIPVLHVVWGFSRGGMRQASRAMRKLCALLHVWQALCALSLELADHLDGYQYLHFRLRMLMCGGLRGVSAETYARSRSIASCDACACKKMHCSTNILGSMLMLSVYILTCSAEWHVWRCSFHHQMVHRANLESIQKHP